MAQRREDAVTFIRVGVIDPMTQARRLLTSGSGFLIDRQGHIITARHVVMHSEREQTGQRWISVSMRDRDANPYPAQIVACETGNIDLCLIKISDSSVAASNILTVFQPVCRHLRRQEAVTAFGYPYGALNQVIGVPGEVTGDLATELKYPSNVQIIPGMSGGPVLDTSGRAIAVNAAGAAEYPTLTFLQPLIYGEGLIRRAGVGCEGVQATTAAAPPATAACLSRRHVINRTQLSQNEAGPSQRQYSEAIPADAGCRIVSIIPSIRSANNASDPSISIEPDGTAAVVSYSLTSGPFFDRYRGWLEADLAIRQEPRP